MKLYIDKEVTKTYKVKTVDNTICDICGKAYKGEEWESWAYDVNKTVFKIEQGSSYPEGGNTTTISYDICPDCFLNKVIPLVKTIAKNEITVTEKDW